MASAFEDLELDGEPNPEFVGQPCAFCGQASEGYFSIHRDGFDEGPEVALCVACGGYETPSCEDIWDKISMAGREHVKAKEATVHVDGKKFPVHDVNIVVGKRTPTKQQLAQAWGCDCCGVQRYQRAPEPITAKLVGGHHPGIWLLKDVRLCEVCMNQRGVQTVVAEVVSAAFDGKPVKGQIFKVEGAAHTQLWSGLDQWLKEHDKGTAVRAQRKLELGEGEREAFKARLGRGRAVFGEVEED